MKFDGADLGAVDQGLRPVEHQIGRVFVIEPDLFEVGRGMAPRVALEKDRARDPVRRAKDRAGTAPDMGHDPPGHGLEVPGKIEFGYWSPVARVGPDDFVRVGDGNAHEHV